VVVVGSTIVAMLILSPILTALSVAVVPIFVVLSNRVGRTRRRARSATQISLAEMSAITQETLSVSGILLAKVFGRQDREIERYSVENARQADLGRTTIAIAHRFSTIRAADIIFVLAAGQIAEHGTHDELVSRGGLYARLYEEQFGSGTVQAFCSDGIVLSDGRCVRPASANSPGHGEMVPSIDGADMPVPADPIPTP
jgi:ABC-type multidrug transport system fused ATPase/permease subunit